MSPFRVNLIILKSRRCNDMNVKDVAERVETQVDARAPGSTQLDGFV